MPKGKDQQTPPSGEETLDPFKIEPESGVEDPDLLGQIWDSQDDPAPEPEPEEEEVGDDGLSEPEEAEPESDEPEEAEEPDEEVEDEPEAPQTFKVKDKEYDLDTLVKDGVLEDLITQASQVAHFQKLYEETKSQLDHQAEVQQQVQPQPQQRQPQFSPEQIMAQAAPMVDAAVREGWMEPELVQDYPRFASSQMAVLNRFNQLEQLVAGMYRYFMQQSHQQAYQSTKSNYDTACATIADRHELFAGLKDEKEREEFFTFLSTKVNPKVDNIDEEFLASQYLGYKKASVLEAVRGGKNQRKAAKRRKKKLAKGEGGSPRKGGGGKKKQDRTIDDMVLDGMMEQFS